MPTPTPRDAPETTTRRDAAGVDMAMARGKIRARRRIRRKAGRSGCGVRGCIVSPMKAVETDKTAHHIIRS